MRAAFFPWHDPRAHVGTCGIESRLPPRSQWRAIFWINGIHARQSRHVAVRVLHPNAGQIVRKRARHRRSGRRGLGIALRQFRRPIILRRRTAGEQNKDAQRNGTASFQLHWRLAFELMVINSADVKEVKDAKEVEESAPDPAWLQGFILYFLNFLYFLSFWIRRIIRFPLDKNMPPVGPGGRLFVQGWGQLFRTDSNYGFGIREDDGFCRSGEANFNERAGAVRVHTQQRRVVLEFHSALHPCAARRSKELPIPQQCYFDTGTAAFHTQLVHPFGNLRAVHGDGSFQKKGPGRIIRRRGRETRRKENQNRENRKSAFHFTSPSRCRCILHE